MRITVRGREFEITIDKVETMSVNDVIKYADIIPKNLRNVTLYMVKGEVKDLENNRSINLFTVIPLPSSIDISDMKDSFVLMFIFQARVYISNNFINKNKD